MQRPTGLSVSFINQKRGFGRTVDYPAAANLKAQAPSGPAEDPFILTIEIEDDDFGRWRFYVVV